MELFTTTKNLKTLNANQIIGEAVKIPVKSSSLNFFMITLIFILPLSLTQLLFEGSFLNFCTTLYGYFCGKSSSPSEFFYFLSLFLFSLFSTSAIAFTVASLYASKYISFVSTLFAIPRISKHLIITFFYSLLLIIINVFAFFIPASILGALLNINEGALRWGFIIIFAIIHNLVHLYVTALWHLASAVSVLEPNVYGLAAMKKSKQLLQGKTIIGMELVYLYITATWVIGLLLGYAMQFPIHFMVKILLGSLCLFMLVAVNLMGLLVQNVFFFACKAHHKEVVDKNVLFDHLCGYDHDRVGYKSVALNPPSTGSLKMRKDHGRVGYQSVEVIGNTDCTIMVQGRGRYQSVEVNGNTDSTIRMQGRGGYQSVEVNGNTDSTIRMQISIEV
ncbi:hypothetical protein MKX03_022108 [Papaver bracteatum]|nr:hypothetical protein MKX03_022108 [Papaver bracteatum]